MEDPKLQVVSNLALGAAAAFDEAGRDLRRIIAEAIYDYTHPLNRPGAADNGEGVCSTDLFVIYECSAMLEDNLCLQNRFRSPLALETSLETSTGTLHLNGLADAVEWISETLHTISDRENEKDRYRQREASSRFNRDNPLKCEGVLVGKAMGKKSPLSQVWNAEDVTVGDRIESGGDFSWEEYVEFINENDGGSSAG